MGRSRKQDGSDEAVSTVTLLMRLAGQGEAMTMGSDPADLRRSSSRARSPSSARLTTSRMGRRRRARGYSAASIGVPSTS